jgi:hypothetical protein
MLTPPVRVSLDDALLFKDPRTMSARQQIAYLEKLAVINDDDALRTAALALGIRGVRDDRPALPVTAGTDTAAEIAADAALVVKKTKKKAKLPVACDGDAGGLCAVCTTGCTALVPDSSVLLRCSECASLVHPACVRHPTDLIGSRRSDWRCRPCHQRAHESFLAAKSAQAAVLTTTTTAAVATKRKRPAGAAAVRRKPAVKKALTTNTTTNNTNNRSMSSSSSDDDSDDDDHEDGEESSSSSSSAASSSSAKAPTTVKTPPAAAKRTPPKPTLKATTAVTPPKPKPIQILFSAPPVVQTPLARDRLFDATPAKSVIASNDRSPSAAAAAAGVSAPPVAAATTPTPTVPPVNDPPRRKLQLKDPASLKRSAELHRSSGSATTTGAAAAAATAAAAASSATASTAPVAAVPSAQDVEFQQNMQRMLEKRAQSQRAVLDADFKVPLRKAQSDDPAASHRPVGAGPVAVVRIVPPPLPPLPSLLSPPVKLKQAEGVGALWKVVPTPAVASPVLAQARVSAWDCFLAARAPLVANYLHLPVKSAQVLGVVQQQFIDLAPHEKQMYHAMADRRRQNVDAAIAEHDRFQAAFPEAFECPACALYITEDQFWQHYEWEAARKARHGQLTRLADVGAPPRLWSPLTDN